MEIIQIGEKVQIIIQIAGNIHVTRSVIMYQTTDENFHFFMKICPEKFGQVVVSGLIEEFEWHSMEI